MQTLKYLQKESESLNENLELPAQTPVIPIPETIDPIKRPG